MSTELKVVAQLTLSPSLLRPPLMSPGVPNNGYSAGMAAGIVGSSGDGAILAAIDMGVAGPIGRLAAAGRRDTALEVQVQALSKLHAQKASRGDVTVLKGVLHILCPC